MMGARKTESRQLTRRVRTTLAKWNASAGEGPTRGKHGYLAVIDTWHDQQR